MPPTLDFTRWNEPPRGVMYRRWVIASTGLRHLFRTRFFRLVLILAWASGVLIAMAGLVLTQSLASGGWLETLARTFGPRAEAVVAAFGAFVLLYPDIVVGGIFTLIFYGQSVIGLLLSQVAMTVLAPRLIARDRANQALTIYLCRPLTSLDYLAGKFGIIIGTLLAIWTGPLLFGWVLSVLFAPDSLFVVHSLAPLLRALLFNGICLVVLAAIAFAVSSMAKTSRGTIFLWIGLWIVLGTLADVPLMPDWVKHASFSHNLRIARDLVFGLDDALTQAGQSLPLLNQQFSQSLSRAGAHLQPDNVTGVIVGLSALVVASSLLFFRRLRPE